MGVPSRIISPSLGVSRPARRPRSVLLPLPLAPTMATNWPEGMLMLMPLRISTFLLPFWIHLRTLRTSIIRLVAPGACLRAVPVLMLRGLAAEGSCMDQLARWTIGTLHR